LIEAEDGAEKVKGKFNFGAERRLAEMEAALKAANSARAEAERKLAEVERTRVASFAHTGAHAGVVTAPRLAGAEPNTIEGEVLRRWEAPPRKPPRGIKVETTKISAKSAKRGRSSSSLLTLGLSSESYAPPPPQDTSRKEEIKLVGYVAAISLLLLALIVLGMTAYRLL